MIPQRQVHQICLRFISYAVLVPNVPDKNRWYGKVKLIIHKERDWYYNFDIITLRVAYYCSIIVCQWHWRRRGKGGKCPPPTFQKGGHHPLTSKTCDLAAFRVLKKKYKGKCKRCQTTTMIGCYPILKYVMHLSMVCPTPSWGQCRAWPGGYLQIFPPH